MWDTGHGAGSLAENRLAPPSFRRELTPTWLSACALLAGAPPIDLNRGLRVLDLKCRSGHQSAVLAAVHPDAEVLAYDDDPAHVERARDLAAETELDNLSVAELADLHRATDCAGDVDVLMLDDVVALSDDKRSAEIREVVRRRVRPGGLIAVTYRTSSAWAGVAPLRHLARQLGDDVARLVEVLARLRDGAAHYVVDRPYVRDIVDELLAGPPEVVQALLLDDRSEPSSLAAMSSWLAPAGACFVGRARFDGADELCRPLGDLLADTQEAGLREQLRDIAARPPYRIDVFRRGRNLLAGDVRLSRLLDLELVDSGGHERQTVRQLLERAVEPADAGAMLRSVMARGLAHPLSIMPSDSAASRASRLDQCLARLGAGIRVDSVIGSAVGGDVA